MFISTSTLRTLLGIGGALLMLLPASAEAQILRRRGRPLLRAPLVQVQQGPYGGTSVRAPLVAVDPGGVRIGLRRRRDPLPVYAIPPRQASRPAASSTAAPAQQDPNQVEQAAHFAEASLPLPSLDELDAMEDSQLIAELGDLADRFDRRLGRLTTGAGWQHYLHIPEEALHDPAVNLGTLNDLLARFDSVADNPEYAKIAGLPSFIATKAALRQAVARLDGPQIVDPSGAAPITPRAEPDAKEILPIPDPAVEPATATGEHSILKPVPAE